MLIFKEKINSVMADEFPYNEASFAKRSGAVFVAENRQLIWFLCVNFYIRNIGYSKG
jgi:hypothetical protein